MLLEKQNKGYYLYTGYTDLPTGNTRAISFLIVVTVVIMVLSNVNYQSRRLKNSLVINLKLNINLSILYLLFSICIIHQTNIFYYYIHLSGVLSLKYCIVNLSYDI